ncbi:hypothetical protein IRZ71_04945 [Flavobacterium sp. ANB]|uniref:hypothetical protein n=1 Tax=unclassified Flavobacterium TaxID=196869 RepID=UPI0012B780AD|nr:MULTISPECIES: hypothetical protein [unclassified Flavobacterium]MBF4515674.1 hypothetical protein [Flavobacterium sp. ANB]MTD68677.1 hypothetical protein [Flavobacterium sp. LC2016-13]
MKKIVLILFLLFPFFAQAQLETYGRYTNGGSIELNINYFTSKKITNKLALTFFGLVEQKWSEALIGVSYSPSKLFNFGASAGIEHGTKSPRYSISMRTGKEKTTFAMLWELGDGKDNYLYKANLFHQYSDVFTFGFTASRFHGVGPNFRFSIPKLSSTIWTMPAYDFEAHQSKLMIGLVLKM